MNKNLEICNPCRVYITPQYLNKYILKILGPVGHRLWNEFSTSEYKNSPYICARI